MQRSKPLDGCRGKAWMRVIHVGYVYVALKLEFHDADRDILAVVLARK